MKIFHKLKELITILNEEKGSWALCGGIAATIYREHPRYTGDIDIAVIDTVGTPAKDFAERCLLRLGYQPIVGFIPNRRFSGQALVCGREAEAHTFLGIDFLLPVLPWVHQAVLRAQSNLLDFGFDQIPTITIEDLIVAKLYSFETAPERILDKDDILNILKTDPALDLEYLKRTLLQLGISVEKEIISLLVSGQ